MLLRAMIAAAAIGLSAGTVAGSIALLLPDGRPVAADPFEDAQTLFRSLHGEWSCEGAFANGKPLAADLRFTPTSDGRAVRYAHVDRAPSRYAQDAVWAFDAASGRIASAAAVSVGSAEPTSVSLYVADAWAPDSLQLDARPLLTDPWAPNRFSYAVRGDSLRMVWELQQGGAWRMGDYLDCERRR